MAKKGKYIVDIEEGQSMSLSPPLKIGATVRAVVKFTGDGKIASRGGRSYWKGEEPRNLKASLSRRCANFQSYYERTGKRWEVEQERKDARKRAKAEAERKRKRLRMEKAEELRAVLDRIVYHPDLVRLILQEATGDRLVQAVREAEELLNLTK